MQCNVPWIQYFLIKIHIYVFKPFFIKFSPFQKTSLINEKQVLIGYMSSINFDRVRWHQ